MLEIFAICMCAA